ncbi:type II toxin-antitoxin system HicA family toxin [Sinosporangium siamense]|uniref:type II toxin-antitoxin system HicA family toxin n=1 Tax=Sinosporangium siamense TaxID=1367973 RepID=UPI0019509AF6|nr:type II toxin-antitoxin system HicA family toxin [Sinosporangium siamense]
MPPVPSLPGAQVVRALEKAGFDVARVRGSHHILRHEDGRVVSVPVHLGRDLPKGTLRNILSLAGMTADELTDLL